MAAIEHVSGTAFVVAEFRAAENHEMAPLYQDAIVGLFLDEDTKRAAARVTASFPPTQDLVRIRTKYFDDMLEQQLRTGVRQVVLLGAGLDTRAVRKSVPDVVYFEIDDAATLKLKERRYRQLGIDVGVIFVPGDYVTDGLMELLDHNSFDPALPTYLIWEGNTMYLSLDNIGQVLGELRNEVRQFRLSFDYLAESVISKTTGDSGITKLAESFAAMGAPWISGIGDVHTLAAELRLGVVENFSTAELYQRYWPARPMTSRIFEFYSVCTLAKV